MQILLDECVNERLRNYLRDQDVQSARYAGFSGLKSGELLDAAESAGFDVLLTGDRGFGHQQNLAGRKIAVLILRTKSIALAELIRHVPVSRGPQRDEARRDRRGTLRWRVVSAGSHPSFPGSLIRGSSHSLRTSFPRIAPRSAVPTENTIVLDLCLPKTSSSDLPFGCNTVTIGPRWLVRQGLITLNVTDSKGLRAGSDYQ